MLNIISLTPVRPNRVKTPERSKGEQYHTDQSRWIMGRSGDTKLEEWRRYSEINRNFYANKQWDIPEDIQQFLMDESGQDTNRVKVTFNYIQPMVEQGRGNAMRMSFDHSAQSTSPLAIVRKETDLGKLLFFNDVAIVSPELKPELQKRYGIGDTKEDTTRLYDNTYVDNYSLGLERLCKYVMDANDMDQYKGDLAKDMYLEGIGIMKPYIHSGEQRFERILPKTFGFDNGAKKSDLSDAGFFYIHQRRLPTEIYEQYDISNDNARRIEDYVSLGDCYDINGSNYSPVGRIEVYEAYWRDCVTHEYGYVDDGFGDYIFEKINYIALGEEEPRYTDKDLIPYNKLTPYQKKIINKETKKKNNKRKVIVDQWRYCIFIPGEILSGQNGQYNHSDPYKYDLTLEYGILPYQEPDLYSPTNMKPPFKVAMWSYCDGEILAPASIAINPQRMINRLLSVMEGQLNNQGGTGVAIAEDMLGENDQVDVAIAVKKSQPVFLDSKGMGINQAIAKYDASLSQNTMNYAGLVDVFKQALEQTTGVNDAIKGESQGDEQLVGVMKLMIQRGSVIQEPIYNAIEKIYYGCYQHVITSGKRLYIDNKRKLTLVTGDTEAKAIILSEDMKNEEFRITLQRSLDSLSERQEVDTLLGSYLEAGLIDRVRWANLNGRASKQEMYKSLREAAKEAMEVELMQQQQQQVQMQQETQQMAQMQQQQQASETEKEMIKEQQSFANKMKEKEFDADTQHILADKKQETELYKINNQRNSDNKK